MSQKMKIIINLIILSFILTSCHKKKSPIEIKLVLLNSENYFNQTISLKGTIKEVGPLNLWFILEDDSGYIQVSTKNLSKKLTCLKKGQKVFAFGQLEQYSIHKYFTLQQDLQCL